MFGSEKEVESVGSSNKVHPDDAVLTKEDEARDPQNVKGSVATQKRSVSGSFWSCVLDWFQQYVYYMPVINVIYDVIGGHIPDFATIKSLVETNGVVAALIFSISMSIPYTMTYDDWDKLYELFDDEDGPYYECSFKFDWLVSTYTTERNNAILFVLLALIATLLIAIEMNVSELQDDNNMLRSWWLWHRYVIFSTFILQILSVTATIRSLVYYTIMMVPNPYVMANGCSSYDDIVTKGGYYTLIAFTKHSNRKSNTWANTARLAFIYAVPLPALALLIWSCWIISEAKQKRAIDADQEKEQTENKEPEEDRDDVGSRLG